MADALDSTGIVPAPDNSLNPFDAISDEPSKPAANPFDAIGPGVAPGSSTTGSFLHSAERGALPAAGGLAGAGAGAEAGAALGALGGPVGSVVGGIAGGFAGALGGSYLIGKAQDYALSKLPDSWRDALGQSDHQQALEEKQHPYASFLGGLAPYALTMSPGGLSRAAASLPENATTYQRLLANPLTARLFSGTIMGGMELGQEKAEGQSPDWAKVGISTAFGMVFNRPTRFGESLEELGARPVRNTANAAVLSRALSDATPGAPRPAMTGEPPAAEPAPAAAAAPAAPEVSGRDWNEVILGQRQPPAGPTVAQAGDAKVMGPGITESVFQGTHEQAPQAAMSAQEDARNETELFGNVPGPDVTALARTMDPETFARYDELSTRRETLLDWLNEGSNAETPEAQTVRQHLAETETELAPLAEARSAAFRRAADFTGQGEEAPGAAAPPAEDPALAAQRATIANDISQKLIAAGRPADEAEAAGQLIAARYEARAARFNGALGTAEELYRREGPVIRGPDGKIIATPPQRTAPEPVYVPGVKAYGTDDADTLKKQWADTSPIRSVDDLFARAQENQDNLASVANTIAKDTGTEFINPGIKGRPRTEEKVAQGKHPARVTDVVRGGFTVDHPGQAETILQALAKHFEVADEGWYVTPAGYFDRKILVRFPNGQVGEVQLWHPELLKRKEEEAHRLYEEARSLPDGNPRKAELGAQMKAIYEAALADASDEWKALAGRAGSDGNLALNAASDSTRPSMPISEELPRFQTPPENTQASPSDQTNGSPSTVPNVRAEEATAESPREVAAEYPAAAESERALSALNDMSPQEQKRDVPAFTAETDTNLPQREAGAPAGVFMFDPTALNVDAKRFQFKSGGDQYGVTGALRSVKKWDPAKAQAIIVWEQSDGRLFVADGHQRAGLARRLTEEGNAKNIQLPGLLFRERDGVTADDARAIAAVTNIANGSGSALDGAKVLRARPDLMDGSLPLSEGKGKQAANLARLDDEAFRMVVNEVVPENQAAVVGELIPRDGPRQIAAMKAIARFEPKNVEETTALVQRVAAAELAKAEEGRQTSMFGDLETADSTAGEEMRIVGRAIKDLKKDKALFSRVVANAERIEQTGSTIARDSAEGVASESDIFARVLASDAYSAGPLRQELIAAARDLKHGKESLAASSARILSALRRQAEEGGGGGAGHIESTEPAQEALDQHEFAQGPDEGLTAEPSASDAGGEAAQARVELRQPDKALAERAYYGTSHSPERRAAADIADFHRQVQEFRDGLDKIAETLEQKALAQNLGDEFHNELLKRQESIWQTRTGMASSMIAGPSKFKKTTRANNAYDAKVADFLGWLKQQPKKAEAEIKALRNPDQISANRWKEVRKGLAGEIATIRSIDSGTGPFAGFNRQSFVSSLAGIIRALDRRGETEMVQRALAFVREAQAPMGKPIFTDRHPIWKLEAPADNSLKAEPGAEGLPQTLIPGVAPVTDGDRLAIEAAKPLTGGNAAPPAGGLFDEDARNQTDLFQEARGKIRIVPGKAPVITLMKDANASTFLHETGHQWLEELMRDAAHPQAPDDLKADAATVLKWLGVETPDAIKTRQHEKFARGFEQYMREGIAPSARLARVFQQFKSWLVSIYETARGLGKPINDDIRGVFDRLITAEPKRTVIAEEPARGPSLADIHMADAAETAPAEADAAFDRVTAESTRYIQDQPPETQRELETALAKTAPVEGNEGSPGAATSETGGETEPGAGAPSEMERGGDGSEPLAGGGGGGAQHDEIEPSSGAARPEGNGASGASARPAGNDARNAGLAPSPGPELGGTEPRFIDRAGNIRLDNLTTRADVADAIREAAEANDDFIGDRRGIVTDGQVMDLADALGMDFDELQRRKVGQAFNAEQIMAARKLLIQSATYVADLMKRAATGTDADVMAYAQAKDRHQMIQAQVAGITAEAGRALRAFRNIAGQDAASTVDQFLKTATGKTLYQLRMEAKLGTQLDTPAKVSKFLRDAQRRTFGRMVLEYWINGLISGPSTHATYMIGNTVLALWKAIPETGLAALVGAAREAMGREGATVQGGEVGARLAGAWRALPAGAEAAIEGLRTGMTTLLPGEQARPMMPFSGDTGLTVAQNATNEDVHWRDVGAAAFGLVRGLRDGIVSGAALLKAGGVEGAPLVGASFSPLGQIPDLAIRGVPVLPVGTAARLPGRFIASIHSFFRAINYSMEKNALAFRTAAEEGLDGTAFDARVADIRQNPSAEVMEQARHEATDLTLMGQGSEFVKSLAKLTNAEVFGFPLLKFVDPFVHIAGNIIDQSLIQRTPLGVFAPEVRADLMGRNGTIAQDTAIAKMMAGTALALTFGGLAAEGLMSGSGPTDPRKAAMWRLAGNQAHSVRIGDIWYDVHRLGPLGMLMGVSADLYDVAHSASKEDLATVGSMLVHSFTQNILDESFMRGPADLIKALEDSDRYGAAYVRNFLSSFVPYSVGMAQMARASDPYSRQTRTIMDAIKAKVPGLSESLFPRRDIWGEPMANSDALGAKGLTAIYERQMSHDPVNVAMLNLGMGPAPVSRSIRNVKLSDQQYDDYARIAGRMAKMRLDAIVRSPDFQTWDDGTKRNVITETITQSREAARGVMMMKYPSLVAQAVDMRLKKLRGEPLK